ncbi:cell division protein FtsW [Candidatus Roizmanbacteria bacterium RIFCSPHIGHO2_01_FULL_39_12c]|uniref:Probable peptidoglycan glycosyltransferase FtsW n=1 Tax=Candidatus Roizmanbacteria bacterium RIFCSPHIGHO2_01_FULL_39_12c TaxID=1802031 RepID=A0A1F7GEN7_9BACT|nr:MAG: cell division protein FtsW [Candidatus Roizmanbacteria bacterium RIFCSPHIGHO2_01_FULL_39_12c]OGK48064.1 MAG: cell division protein FtsW [Candidatus Roizmanbacteria bacterium RIFCSPLOWO2_01_FULL_40_13]
MPIASAKKSRLKQFKPYKKRFLGWLYTLPIILSLVGLFFVFEASSVSAFQEFGDSFHFLKLQAVWLVFAVAAMIFFSFFDYHKLYYLSFLFLVGTIVLLMIVLIPGIGSEVGGARRWIDLGFFNLQPTELAKFSVIIYLSSWFMNRERKRFFSFITLLIALMFLIILQPDLGTAIIVFSLGIVIYFLAGIELWYLIFLLPLSLGAFFLLVKISPYRLRRVLAFFDPNLDPLGITYHINQIMISLESGGLFGLGLGASRQKYLYLPEAHTDSIFAIIGEEFGFIGGVLLISVYIYLMYRLYQITQYANDRFGKLLAGGAFAFFSLQTIINLAGMVNLLPLTGVPLPFISYGGSNLLVSFILIGITINIAKRIKFL